VTGPDAYPVTVRTEKDGKEATFEAKYVLVSGFKPTLTPINVSRAVMEHIVLYEGRLDL
jgi:hypothetical protein